MCEHGHDGVMRVTAPEASACEMHHYQQGEPRLLSPGLAHRAGGEVSPFSTCWLAALKCCSHCHRAGYHNHASTEHFQKRFTKPKLMPEPGIQGALCDSPCPFYDSCPTGLHAKLVVWQPKPTKGLEVLLQSNVLDGTYSASGYGRGGFLKGLR